MIGETLGDFVEVRRRYQKSVHLERDASSEGALAGYILTPMGRAVLARLVASLHPDATQRAFSLTGPYGTGKSSFAVVWATLLGEGQDPRTKQARKLLRSVAPELSQTLFGRKGLLSSEAGFVTVLATGERTSLEEVVLRALVRGLESFWSGRGAKPSILREVAAALKAAEKGKRVGSRRVVDLVRTASEKVAQSANPGNGIVLILDEAGKCLEFAAHEPHRGDVQLLQELAEAANRSQEAPIVFITILHQSIERYASRLGAAQRNEWAKVQGRFEDIAFQEESDQLLRLVGAALEVRAKLPMSHARNYSELADSVVEQVVGNDVERALELKDQLDPLFPLHPMTGLILGPLFRARLAQNERSLFSFLCSGEPLGFQEHLGRDLEQEGAPLYRVDQLYDYVVAALGAQLYGHDGRVWAEIDTALRRLPKDANEIDARLLKTIGLLGAVGEQGGLRASRPLIELCVQAPKKDVGAALERLESSSAIVYRKYRDAFHIWEGSDLDLESLLRGAFEQTETRSGLAQRLSQLAPPRPIVARRHLFKTGTLRYFEVRFAEADSVEDEMKGPTDDGADGAVLIALPRAGGDCRNLRKLIAQQMFWFAHTGERTKPLIVGIPRCASHLADLAAELSALEWVQSNTPELAKDPVARRELTARIAETRRLVLEESGRLLDGGTRQGCEWFYRGDLLRISSSSDLARELSAICDRTYHDAPFILNELINRRQVSSAAAAARRSVLEAMVEKTSCERLGFQGFPPEVSIYRSVLEAHKLHRKRGADWTIAAPSSRKEGSLRPVWKAIEGFLSSTESHRRSVADLYQLLREPPYGVKDGVLPLITCAALLHLDAEVALYEGGAFIPGLTTPVIERLLRWPEKFELQRFKISGVRAEVFERFGKALLTGPEADRPTLLAIVRSLVRFVADLSDYARVTKSVSPTAQEVRAVLRRAKEPAPLLFADLPKACGVPAFTAMKGNSNGVEAFFATLKRALAELQASYPNLLEETHATLASEFGIEKKADLRDQLSFRSRRMLDVVAEADLKAFLLRASDDALPDEEWLVSIATHLATKPPPKWNDQDCEHMRVTLAKIGRKFRSIEPLAIEMGHSSDSAHDLMRLSITRPEVPELERLISVRHSDLAQVRELEKRLLEALGAAPSTEIVLAALAGAAASMLATPRDAEGERLHA